MRAPPLEPATSSRTNTVYAHLWTFSRPSDQTSNVFFLTGKNAHTTQLKTSSPTHGACVLRPPPRSPQNPAAHHGTLVCRRQRLLWCAAPAKTSRKLLQLHMTGSLATVISRPAALSDTKCEVHAGTSLWPTDSGRTMSQGTSDHPIRRQAPPTWPFLEGRPAPDMCALSSSWQPRAPSVSAVPGRADPSQCNVEIKVVSIASCAPANNGSPSATISKRRASPGFGAAKSISRTVTFVLTRAPPSRQILAAVLSTAKLLLPKTPALAQGTDKGMGDGDVNINKRNSAGSMRVRGHVGHVCSAAPAPEPPCDLSRALSGCQHSEQRLPMFLLNSGGRCVLPP